MNVLGNPSQRSIDLGAAETGADRKSPRYASHRLMEKSSVAGLETAHELVHPEFESVGIVQRDNRFPLLLSAGWPAGPIVVGIEVFSGDLRRGLIEDPRPFF